MQTYNMLVAEKIRKYGPSALSDQELIQALVWSGVKGSDYKYISRNVDAIVQKVGVDNITIDDLMAIKGIGLKKASAIIGCLEYFRRRLIKPASPLVDSPEKAAELFKEIAGKKQEHFMLLTLNGARRLIKKHLVTIGTLMSSLVHPREVYSCAIEDRAASIIIGHNHPSGYLDISDNDREVTTRLRQAGDIIGIRLDDHIIVTGTGGCFEYISAY